MTNIDTKQVIIKFIKRIYGIMQYLAQHAPLYTVQNSPLDEVTGEPMPEELGEIAKAESIKVQLAWRITFKESKRRKGLLYLKK